MPTVETVKNNILKVAFGSIGSVIAIVAALFAVDERYAHAADVGYLDEGFSCFLIHQWAASIMNCQLNANKKQRRL